MINIESVLSKLDIQMKERMSRLSQDFSGLRTGRASPQLLENVKVEAYGQSLPLKQVGAISIPEARVIEIRPWDPSVVGDVEKALQKADLGAMPQSDGKTVRLSLPTMTEERRKDLVKVMRRLGEDCRVALRTERHETLEIIKKAEKAKEIGQDQARGAEARVQKITDSFMGRVESEMAAKEREILTV